MSSSPSPSLLLWSCYYNDYTVAAVIVIMIVICIIDYSHLDSKGGQGFGSNGYFCPQCKSKYCELPIECKACGEFVDFGVSVCVCVCVCMCVCESVCVYVCVQVCVCV